MYVCLCRAVTDRDVEQAVACGHTTLPALQATLGVATGCGRCRSHVHQMLRETPEPSFSGAMPPHTCPPMGASVG